jgi:predicted NUDIX family NTP pyrophosphohydrolase
MGGGLVRLGQFQQGHGIGRQDQHQALARFIAGGHRAHLVIPALHSQPLAGEAVGAYFSGFLVEAFRLRYWQMALRVSAGLIMYRFQGGELEVFLAHPGGPYAAREDEGYWTIPKGRQQAQETLLQAAKREFEEEVGIKPSGPYLELGSIRQKGGKIVHAWAFEGQWDESQPIRSNTFEMSWPPYSGRLQQFPEIDRARFFNLAEARKKLKDTQCPLLDRLESMLALYPPGQRPKAGAAIGPADS